MAVSQKRFCLGSTLSPGQNLVTEASNGKVDPSIKWKTSGDDKKWIGRGQQAENGNSYLNNGAFRTYSFSLGAQQTRTLSRPIWSPTLLVSITSNARSGGKPFAHRERPSPVHKVTFKQRRNKQWRRRQQRQSQKRKGLIRETTLLVYHTFLRRCCTKTLRLRRNFRLCIPHIAYRSRGTHS